MSHARVLDNVPAVGKGAAAITKSDSTAVDFAAIYVGGAGDVKVTCVDGSVAVFTAVPAGTILPVAVVLVWSAGTTATNMTGIV